MRRWREQKWEKNKQHKREMWTQTGRTHVEENTKY
jgi:hypothetical protein